MSRAFIRAESMKNSRYACKKGSRYGSIDIYTIGYHMFCLLKKINDKFGKQPEC